MSGSVGDFTFKQVNGQTIVSEKITKQTNPRSDAQMRVRTRWNNIVAMFRGIKPLLKNGFENKAAGLTDFNMFMKVNMQQTPVYLTKSAVAGGACVAAAYQITQGSLPVIAISGTGSNSITNIFLNGETLSNTTTVAQFSKLVVDNNADYKYGDQISYFLIKQKVSAAGIPYCQFLAYSVVLDAANTDKLYDSVPKNGFSTQDGCIGHSGNDGDCAFAWVHSRKSSSKTLVSSQTLIVANTKLAEYQGETAYALAKSSYGESTDPFLTPGVKVAEADSADSGSQGGGDSL